MTTDEVDFRAQGFLAAFPGKEYRVRGNASELGRGNLLLQTVCIRMLSDVVIEAAAKQGARLSSSFDYAHPDFVLLETVASKAAVHGLVKDIEAAGYRNLDLARLLILQQKPYELTRGGEALEALPEFMTEKEVAKYLRKGLATVQRFSDEGGLPFIPGRPRVIAKADLLNFLKTFKTVRPVSIDWQRERAKHVPYGMGVVDTESKLVADARARAMRMKMKPVRRSPRASK